MRYTLLSVLFCFLTGAFLPAKIAAQKPDRMVNISDTFPVPTDSPHLLFYIQRTHNKNTIMYEVNYNADSTINEAEPVKVYWIRYSDRGERAPLSYIQRNYAYGIESLMTDKEKKVFKINLVSYKKRPIYLIRPPGESRYRACIVIDNKLAYLCRAFAKIEGGTFWVPHITYVELTGKDPVSGKTVTEKIIP